jgi:hypothetical protein
VIEIGARMVCPVCARRHAALVSTGCVVCSGIGSLSLGPNVLHVATPPVGALAVTLFLEAAARRHATLPYAELPAVVEHSVARLRALGVLATTHDEPDHLGRNEPPLVLAELPDDRSGPSRERGQARALVRSWGEEPSAGDEQRLEAGPIAPGEIRERAARAPGRWPPTHSRGGHEGNLSRAADGYPFASPSVVALATRQELDERGSLRLAHALEQVRGADLASIEGSAS